MVDTYCMDSCLPHNPYYNEATSLAAFMGEKGDVNVIQNVLECNQALRNGKPKPRLKLRRDRKPSRPEL